ncbi:MAG: ABC transporter permease [Bacteroidales bacterium]|nr:ABC transporter permease [Bacteroidales bacterium]
MQRANFLHTSSNCFQPYLLPLKNLYLDNLVDVSYEKKGNKTQLGILIVVGILILFIAFSNYIILTLGQFFKKAGEVGIRKSIGGKNLDILKMFIHENTILIFASFILGGVVSYTLIPVFNHISQSQIYLNLINIGSLTVFSVSTIVMLVLLTSIIPVFVFRKVKPTQLVGRRAFMGKRATSSQVFVGLQYTLTIVLIIATIVINKQTNFLKTNHSAFRMTILFR